MFNWMIGFIRDIKNIAIDSAFVFAFGNLIVSTALDLAFHGILKIRLAGGSYAADSAEDGISKLRADYAAGRINYNPDDWDKFINNF